MSICYDCTECGTSIYEVINHRPCYACLKAENDRLREQLATARGWIKDMLVADPDVADDLAKAALAFSDGGPATCEACSSLCKQLADANSKLDIQQEMEPLIAEQIRREAFEEAAKWLGPKGSRTQIVKYCGKCAEPIALMPEDALAQRKDQAREYIKTWCNKRKGRVDWATEYCNTTRDYEIRLEGDDFKTFCVNGQSYAEALTATVEKLAGMEEEEK